MEEKLDLTNFRAAKQIFIDKLNFEKFCQNGYFNKFKYFSLFVNITDDKNAYISWIITHDQYQALTSNFDYADYMYDENYLDFKAQYKLNNEPVGIECKNLKELLEFINKELERLIKILEDQLNIQSNNGRSESTEITNEIIDIRTIVYKIIVIINENE